MKQNHKYIKFDRDNMLHDRHSLQGVGLKHLRGNVYKNVGQIYPDPWGKFGQGG